MKTTGFDEKVSKGFDNAKAKIAITKKISSL